MTNLPVERPSFSEPTAETEIISVTPNCFSASILALELLKSKISVEIIDIGLEPDKIDNIFIAHRVGDVCVKDCLVVIACWAKHRKQSIGAVEYILEELKHNAPLWKKEFYKDNTSRWVENNT